jgi:S1-C subfamily serine protease
MQSGTSLRLLVIGLVMLPLWACSGDDDGGADEGAASSVTSLAQSNQPAGNPFAFLPALVEGVRPSVVAIVTDSGEGSGVIWDGQGRIVTNHHVIEGASSAQVVLASGERLPAEFVASDPFTDLAVLRVSRNNLPGARFAEELPRVGELALALGNPLGFEGSASAGIISGLHRSIPSGGTTPALVDLIQTDAAISPGNSGGALVNSEGEVVGINVAYIPPQASAVSIGFAIPAPTVISVVDQLIKTGSVEHAFLGIEPRPMTPQIASLIGAPTDKGVLVFDVTPGAAAARGGVQPGDVIVEFDGAAVETVEDLYAQLRTKRPGEQATLTVARQGAETELTVTLDDRPR